MDQKWQNGKRKEAAKRSMRALRERR